MNDKKEKLENFRNQIDKIDDKILDLFSERAGIIKQVGDLKGLKNSKKSIIRPGREAEMIRRIAKKAGEADHNFSKAALAQMWRLLISSAIRLEEDAHITAWSQPGDKDCYWLAREYFGAFTPAIQKPTMMEVIQDILDEHSTVGVLPIWDEDSPQPWWSKITEEKDAPKIFAKLPFVQMSISKKAPIVALGYVEPEPTIEDESYWVIKLDDNILFSDLEGIFKKTELEYVVQGSCRVMGNPTTKQCLLSIKGFVGEDDEKIKEFIIESNKKYGDHAVQTSAYYLGSHAVPILFA